MDGEILTRSLFMDLTMIVTVFIVGREILSREPAAERKRKMRNSTTATQWNGCFTIRLVVRPGEVNGFLDGDSSGLAGHGGNNMMPAAAAGKNIFHRRWTILENRWEKMSAIPVGMDVESTHIS